MKPLTLGQELDMKLAISEWGSRYGQIALNEIERLRSSLAAAEAKLADAEKHADELDRALMRLGDALHCAGTFECDDEHSTEYCFVGIQQEARAAHAARRAARDGQEGTR